MRYGEAFVQITTTDMHQASGLGMFGVPGMGMPSGGTMSEEKIQWRERTGEKRGWLLKRDEEKTLRISGLRCIECGYIELYARE